MVLCGNSKLVRFCYASMTYYVLLSAGNVVQTVFGHYDVVTCIARSECNVSQDCYVVTGSKDCTVMVWHWSTKQQRILGDNGSTFTACSYFMTTVSSVLTAVVHLNMAE